MYGKQGIAAATEHDDVEPTHPRHCERSEAIQSPARDALDCFAALAMKDGAGQSNTSRTPVGCDFRDFPV